MPDQHDARYKRLFYNPRLVQELLESFVPLDFVQLLDYAAMERIDKSFVSRRNRKQEGDLLWRIPLAGGGDEAVYLYLLLEFQSTVDRFMALRMLRYICEFYEYLRHASKPAPSTLPPVFPLVLYNGERDWDAPEELGTLIRPRIAAPYLPVFRYHTIVEKDIPDAELRCLKNAIASIFYLEKCPPAEVGMRIEQAIEKREFFQQPALELHKSMCNSVLLDGVEKVRLTFATPCYELAGIIRSLDHPVVDLVQGWINSYLEELPNFETNRAILEKTLPKQEARTMFGPALKEWAKNIVDQGVAEGKAKGKAEGILIEKRQTLARLLERRFGNGATNRELIENCSDLDKLDQCLDLVLDAPAAEDVLAPLK